MSKILKILLCVFCIAFLTGVSAETLTGVSALPTEDVNFRQMQLFTEMQDLYVEYSDDLDQLPMASNIASNEKINVYVQVGDSTLNTAIIIIDGNAAGFERGSLSDPTMNVYTDESTVREIIDSDDPTSAITSALKDGKIKLEGVGFMNSLKIAIANFLMTLL